MNAYNRRSRSHQIVSQSYPPVEDISLTASSSSDGQSACDFSDLWPSSQVTTEQAPYEEEEEFVPGSQLAAMLKGVWLN